MPVGGTSAAGYVLIHGSNAHLEWWRFVAPFLADQFRVVALDLSGNGDSDGDPNTTAPRMLLRLGVLSTRQSNNRTRLLSVIALEGSSRLKQAVDTDRNWAV
ncbi:MAG: hypothetical protein Ct9H300mP8_04700 [Gammaproteobacteria bacterium]|nr:MAG: hypothetical protein Ct9H300mP8_04700 [Gammaproteobacteria bacterium]